MEAVQTINRSGLRVMAGFIIGFDGEKPGAGQRIIDFVEATAIPHAMFSMLQALPNTALWHRLQKEGRLLEGRAVANISQTTLINFIPTRPVEDLAQEYVRCFWELYEPKRYLARTYRHFLQMRPSPNKSEFRLPALTDIRAMLTIFWRQGIKRDTRWQFWQQLFGIIGQNPGVFEHYLIACAHLEHFMDYRQIVKDEITAQLAEVVPAAANLQSQAVAEPAVL
jgi:radical SAM superfamily enzyme YgiQ (UPF0313 family)